MEIDGGGGGETLCISSSIVIMFYFVWIHDEYGCKIKTKRIWKIYFSFSLLTLMVNVISTFVHLNIDVPCYMRKTLQETFVHLYIHLYIRVNFSCFTYYAANTWHHYTAIVILCNLLVVVEVVYWGYFFFIKIYTQWRGTGRDSRQHCQNDIKEKIKKKIDRKTKEWE